MVAIYLCDESNRGRKVEGKRTQVFAAENQSDAAGIRKGEILSNPSTSCRSRLVFVPHSALFFFLRELWSTEAEIPGKFSGSLSSSRVYWGLQKGN